MGLETGTYISDLNPANPSGTDPKSQGDDHIRLLKSTLLATFPNITGALTVSHTELNYVDGVTSPVQTQLNTLDSEKGDLAGATWTGTHNFTGATVSFASGSFSGAVTGVTADPGDDSNKFATTEFVQQAAFSATLPAQTGNAGKVLTTDGSSASWQSLTAPVYATVSGSLTPDFSGPSNFVWTLNGNLTLNVPTDMADGQNGVIYFIQDGTGGRTLTKNAAIKTPGGLAPTLSTAANAVDRCGYFVRNVGGTLTLELTQIERAFA